MTKIALELTVDNSQVSSALQETTTDMAKLGDTTKKTSTKIKEGFDDVQKAAKRANDELSNPAPSQAQKANLTAIQALKKDIRDFTNAALAAGEGTKEFARNIKLAGEAKASLKDLQEQLQALDPDRVAGAFLGLGTSIAGAFTVAQSAVALTGEKNEELEKTLLKVQAAQGLLAGLQSLANTADELAKIKIIALNKINTAQIYLQGAAESKNIVIRGAATAAQYVLNAAMSAGAGGLLVIIGSIAAFGTALANLGDEQESAAEKQERLNNEFDRTKTSIESLIKVQDSYVELLKAQGASQDEISRNQQISFNLRKKLVEEEIELNEKLTNSVQAELNLRLREFELFFSESDAKEVKDIKNKLQLLKDKGEALRNERLVLNNNEKAEVAKNEKEKSDKEKADNEKAIQRKTDFYRALEDLRKRAEQAEIEGETGVNKIKLQEQAQLRELETFRKSLEAKGKLGKEQEEQFAIIENQIRKNANDQILELEKQDLEKTDQAIKDGLQKIQDTRTAQQQADLKALEDSNKAKVLLTQEGSEQRLNAEIKGIEDLRDFQLKNYNLSKDERIIIEQEALNKIKELRQQFADDKDFDLFKLLGLEVSDEQKQELKKSVSFLASSVKDLVNTQLDAEQEALDKRKEINDEILSNSDKKISDLESQLEKELELSREGSANQVTELQNRLLAEKQAKEAALEEEKKIAAEQDKIKRQQAVVDALVQASNILTAGSTLFAKGAFSGPIGIASAIITIGAMVASFASLSAKLKKGFKEGGYTGDVAENEVAGVTHGREYVSTAKTTRKHRPILEALHNEDYSKLTSKDLLPLLEGTGVEMRPEIIKKIVVNSENNSLSKEQKSEELTKGMYSLNKNFNKFFDHYKNKPTQFKRADGSLVTKIGNTTRIIKNGI